ncbi:unnamed protein product [Linum tenue]|uniref:Uncharacterized protein n=1 Tax=Linum tenue TaxID=586396 RepID=A0AAV0QJT4_9ROSI|nr:unnamed protein product [Linum tenue]
MASWEPLVWYCKPVANGVWAKELDTAFGAYTPCAIDSLVICVSYLALFGLCIYRIWLIKDPKAQKYCLRTKYYNYILGLLAAYCTVEPMFRLVMDISPFNLDGETGVAPFEMVSSVVEALSWCSMLIMIGLEIKIYIRKFRWYVRFGVLYVLIAECVVLNLILPVSANAARVAFYMSVGTFICKVLFGILLLFHLPTLDPYPGYVMLEPETIDNGEYEALPGEEQICPERHVNIFSRIYFGWMTSLMRQGYHKPITEKDVWKLDAWDQTETLINKFQKCWIEESKKKNPWLLRALNNSLGARFWLGGLFKIGNDLSQFVGPVILNQLLQEEYHQPARFRWSQRPIHRRPGDLVIQRPSGSLASPVLINRHPRHLPTSSLEMEETEVDMCATVTCATSGRLSDFRVSNCSGGPGRLQGERSTARLDEIGERERRRQGLTGGEDGQCSVGILLGLVMLMLSQFLLVWYGFYLILH